jgi:hypothetical protein
MEELYLDNGKTYYHISNSPTSEVLIAGVYKKIDANRIVQCVNALEGLNPDAIPDLKEAIIKTLYILNEQTYFTLEMRNNIRLLLNDALAKARAAYQLTKYAEIDGKGDL